MTASEAGQGGGDRPPLLVVLGAGSDQRFLLQTARGMGLRTLAFDMNPQAEGAPFADRFEAISTRDVPAICGRLDALITEGERPAGVTTMGSDIPEIVAAVAAHLGTPSVSAETARLATDKFEMKQAFRRAGVPIPWFAAVRDARDVQEALDTRGGRLVVKPVDRSGSRGVFLVDRDMRDRVPALFEAALAQSFSGRVQVEAFVPGPQYSTETVFHRGRGVTPGFADRNYEWLQRLAPRIIENGAWMPTALNAAGQAQVDELLACAAAALGLSDGTAKGDVVWGPDGPLLIEMAARLSGGDFCESLVPLCTGVNYVPAAIDLALGRTPDFSVLTAPPRQAVGNRYFIGGPGRLQAVEGLDEVARQPWIHKLELWYRPGDEVPAPVSHAHRLGVFIATATDKAELDRRIDWVYRTVRLQILPSGDGDPLAGPAGSAA
ncbi:ATP-grasp domain-containing protein [Marinibaculum pumilum]|uniref:ATP-grasp domain-containing protein n=1 Tax=Marinibaculum pumilum TaxID=1766165 RepID=A0ABV7L468_9PROT